MQVCRISHPTEFAALTGPWGALDYGVPFRSHAWLTTWWRHYRPMLARSGRQVEPYVLAVYDGQQLVALAPWYLERSSAAGRIVRFLGSGDVCSDYLSVLSRPDRAVEVADTLAEWLVRASSMPRGDADRWDILDFTCVDAGDRAMALLAAQLQARGAKMHVRATDSTWRIELPSSWSNYLRTLSHSHRKQLRQARRRLFDTGQAVLQTVERADQIEGGWQILTDLHQRRMQSLGRPGCFGSPVFRDFLRDVTGALFQAGRLRLHWLELDGRPIAAEYHLASNDVIYAYQGGVEPQALDAEPGRLITLSTLESAIGAGYRAFDFCRGDESYKAHWRAKARPNLAWRMVCRRPSARLRNQVWTARQSAKAWLSERMKSKSSV